MAQFVSDSLEGLSNLPTNSHAGMVMTHRCAITFAVAATLVAGDKLVLGKLPVGYTVQDVRADSDGITGLSVNVVQASSLDGDATKLTLAAGLSLATEGGDIQGTLTKAAARFKGENTMQYLVAEVAVGGSVTAGKEIGITFDYRYRQVTY
ncbi:hypothetical protein [Acinetobacter variabilis]|uniref:Uncharacterized protein n=1 Tax=Acinetobacter variabilis TaxID=70346 RepID=N8X1C2_9GAMM|nr:hypothetical protein [Acinetobacter variabilis]ENV00945.1 hypothetical protein F969_00031 [Acinetobacter variabilis]MCU4631049.1 hypothetical protein [Acinetobacter variabilis]